MKHTTFLWMIALGLFMTVHGIAVEEVQPRITFKANIGSTRTALITPDDKVLITLGGEYLGNDSKIVGDHAVKVWDLSTGKERDFPKYASPAIALSPDGKILAMVDDRSVRLVKLLTGKQVAAFNDNDFPIESVAFSPDGKTLATGWSKDGPSPGSKVAVARCWEVASGKPIATLEPNKGPMRALAFSPDSKLLAVATQTFPSIGDVKFWDVSTGKEHSTLEAGGVDCIAFSPDGKTLAAGCGSRLGRDKKDPSHHVRLWDVGTGKSLHFIRHEFRVLCVAYSPDGRIVATGSELGELALWDTVTGKLRFSVPNQPWYVLSVAFSKDGKTFVSTNRTGEVKCWDVPKLLDGRDVK